MRCRRCFIGLACELIIKIIRLDFVNIIYHTLSKGNRCSSAIINCVPCHQLEIKLMIPANKFNCCRSREKEKHFTLRWEVHKWEQTVGIFAACSVCILSLQRGKWGHETTTMSSLCIYHCVTSKEICTLYYMEATHIKAKTCRIISWMFLRTKKWCSVKWAAFHTVCLEESLSFEISMCMSHMTQ